MRQGLGGPPGFQERLRQHRSCLDVVGLQAHGLLQRRNRARRPDPAPRFAAPRNNVAGSESGWIRSAASNWGRRLLVLAGEVKGHAEVHEQPGIAGHGLHELTVHGHRFRVPAGRHQLLAALRLSGEPALREARRRALGPEKDGNKEEGGGEHSGEPSRRRFKRAALLIGPQHRPRRRLGPGRVSGGSDVQRHPPRALENGLV